MGRKADHTDTEAHSGQAVHRHIRDRMKVVLDQCVEALCQVEVKNDPASVAATMRAVVMVLKVAEMLYGKAATQTEHDEDQDEMLDEDDFPSAYERPEVDTLDAWLALFDRKLRPQSGRRGLREVAEDTDTQDGTRDGESVGVLGESSAGPSIRRLA